MDNNEVNRKKRKERDEQIDEETPPNKLQKLPTTPPSPSNINNQNNNIENNNENNENNTTDKKAFEINLLEQRDKWVKKWKEFIKVRRKRAKLANEMGNEFFSLEKFDKAIEQFKIAIKNDQNNAIYHANIGKLYVKIGLDKKAIKYFKKVIQLDKTDKEDFCYEFGTSLYSLGKYEESIEFFHRSLEMDPTNFGARLNLSLSLEALNKCNEALNQLEIILSQTEDKEIIGNVYTVMGMIHLSSDRYEEGMEYVKKAIDLNPDERRNYFNIGKILDEKNKYEEAIEYYKKALEMDPDDISAHSNLGDLYIKMKRFDDAINQQKISPELDALLKDENGVITDIIFYLFTYTKIGLALIRKKEFEKAEEMITKIFETLKEVPDIYDYDSPKVKEEAFFISGLFNYKNSRYQKAIEEFDQALLLYHSDVFLLQSYAREINYYYAMSLMKLGIEEKNLEIKNNYFEKAIEKFNQSIKDEKNKKVENDWSKPYYRKAQLFVFYISPTNIEQAKINFQLAVQKNISLAPYYRVSDHLLSSFQLSLDTRSNF